MVDIQKMSVDTGCFYTVDIVEHKKNSLMVLCPDVLSCPNCVSRCTKLSELRIPVY
jgi:hypothetical protein